MQENGKQRRKTGLVYKRIRERIENSDKEEERKKIR